MTSALSIMSRILGIKKGGKTGTPVLKLMGLIPKKNLLVIGKQNTVSAFNLNEIEYVTIEGK